MTKECRLGQDNSHGWTQKRYFKTTDNAIAKIQIHLRHNSNSKWTFIELSLPYSKGTLKCKRTNTGNSQFH